MKKMISIIAAGTTLLSGNQNSICAEAQKLENGDSKPPAIEMHGDVRGRAFIYRNRFSDAPDLDVYQSRFRISPTLRPMEGVEVRARGVAEISNIPNLDPRLVDGSAFYVDRADVKIKAGNQMEFRVGETDNPFCTIPILDKDMPITGIVAEFEPTSGVKLQGAWDLGRVLTEDSRIRSIGGQIVVEKKVEDIVLQGNLGYQHYSNFKDDDFRFTNSKDAKFDVINIGGAAVFPKCKIPTRIFVEGTYNPSMPQNNNALMSGVKFGNADKPKGVEVSFFYNRVSKDSLPSALADRDCPRTNFDAFGVGVKWSPTKNLSIYGVSRNPKHLIPTGKKDNQRMNTLETGIAYRF